MTDIEQTYQQQMALLSPRERVARSMAMLQWTREMLARQILAVTPTISPERLRWEVAKRLYGSDPRALATIQRKLDDVPD